MNRTQKRIVKEINTRLTTRKNLLDQLEAVLIRRTNPLTDKQKSQLDTNLWTIVQATDVDIDYLSALFQMDLIDYDNMNRFTEHFAELRECALRIIKMI